MRRPADAATRPDVFACRRAAPRAVPLEIRIALSNGSVLRFFILIAYQET